MSTTASLPDRLRALADLIERNNLPAQYVNINGEDRYVSVTAADLATVEAWAAVLDVPIVRHDYPESEEPFSAHVATMDYLDSGPLHIAAQFSEHHAQVPA